MLIRRSDADRSFRLCRLFAHLGEGLKPLRRSPPAGEAAHATGALCLAHTLHCRVLYNDENEASFISTVTLSG